MLIYFQNNNDQQNLFLIRLEFFIFPIIYFFLINPISRSCNQHLKNL